LITTRERLLYLTPLVLILGMFLVGPAVFGFFASFTDYAPAQLQTHWVGLANYSSVIHSSEFDATVRNITFITLIGVPAELLLGLFVALLLRKPFRGRGLLRVILLVPWLISPMANGVMWHFLFSSEQGLPSFVFAGLGFPGVPSPLGLSGSALPAIILTDIWRKAPLVAFLLLPNLLTLPREQLEYAILEGASLVSQIRNIALPWLRPLLLTVSLLLVGDTLGSFDNILVLTGGGPGSQTMTPGLYSYREAFSHSNWPVGSTSAWLIVLVIATVGLVYLWLVHSTPAKPSSPIRSISAMSLPPLTLGLDKARRREFTSTDIIRKPHFGLSWRDQRRKRATVRFLFLTILVVFFTLPILWTVLASLNVRPINSISPPAWNVQPSLENYQAVGTTEPGFVDELLMSIAVTFTTTMVTMLVAFLAAYSLTRSKFGVKPMLISSFLILASLPVMAYIIPLAAVIKSFFLYDTFIGVTLALVAMLLPLAVYILFGYLTQVPIEVEEAAHLEGAMGWRMITGIVLPITGTGVAATAVIISVLAWNQFLVPLVLSADHVRGVTMGMVDFFEFDREVEWSSVAAALITSLFPLALLVATAHRLLDRFSLIPTQLET
jgi:multiple sugar transport system permease protein